MVQLFSRYPEHLVAEAIDPVDGLPGECDYLPTIAKAKAFLEPRYLNFTRLKELRERADRKRLPEPPRDPEADKRISDGFKALSELMGQPLRTEESRIRDEFEAHAEAQRKYHL